MPLGCSQPPGPRKGFHEGSEQPRAKALLLSNKDAEGAAESTFRA